MQSSVRTCLGCREKKHPDELLRIVKNENGIHLDKKKKQDGRGAYVCPDPSCMQMLIKKRGLDRAFKIRVREEVYSLLQKEFEELGK